MKMRIPTIMVQKSSKRRQFLREKLDKRSELRYDPISPPTLTAPLSNPIARA
jgi:hypothetical protein